MTCNALTKALKNPDTESLSVTAKTAADLDGISGLSRLRYLTLTIKTKTLPGEVFALAKLTHLTIKGKTLESLDPNIRKLKVLQELRLSGNKLQALPEELQTLRALQALEVANNALTVIPESIGKLSKLKTVDVSKNKLGALPWLPKLLNLEEVRADKCNLETLPGPLSTLKRLQTLSLDQNPGIQLEHVRGIKTLSSLSLRDCKLRSLPGSFDTLTGLRWLCVGKNPFGEVPPAIAKMKKLESLYLWGCELSAVPAWLGDLKKLFLLELEKNVLTDLPLELAKLQSLRELHVDRNRLQVFPEAILQMTALKWLQIYENHIEKLPDAINALTDLEYLRAEENPFTQMPTSMGAMHALSTCNLWGRSDDASWVREQLKEPPPNAYVSYRGRELLREGRWFGDPAPAAPSSREIGRIDVGGNLSQLAFVSSSTALILGYEGLLRAEISTGKKSYENVAPNGNCFALTHDGAHILSASIALHLRDAKTGVPIRKFDEMTRGVAAVDISNDETKGLAIDGAGHIRVFSLDDGSVIAEWNAEGHGRGAVFADDGETVLSYGKRAMRIWNIADGSFRRFVGDKMEIRFARFLPNRQVISGGFDPTIKVWDVAKKKAKVIRTLELGDEVYVSSMEVSPDLSRVLVGTSDRLLRYFDLSTGVEIAQWEGHPGWTVNTIAISADGCQAITGSNDKVVRVWSLD